MAGPIEGKLAPSGRMTSYLHHSRTDFTPASIGMPGLCRGRFALQTAAADVVSLFDVLDMPFRSRTRVACGEEAITLLNYRQMAAGISGRGTGVGDFLATIYRHLGVDAERGTVGDQTGRPVPLLQQGGTPIRELVSAN